MDIDLRNGLMNSCLSGSRIHLHSQRFPKVSIGIMVETTPKMGYAGGKGDETVLPAKEMAPSSQEKIVEEGGEPGTTAIFTEREALGKENVSPWVCTRSMYHETLNAQAIHFHGNASVLQSDDRLHDNVDSATHEKGEKSGNIKKVEEIAFAPMQEMHLLHKGRTGCTKFREGRSEALRMKLWEALGTGSSQNKHTPSPLLADENLNFSKSENYKDCQIHKVPKPKQDTDTIETDSENPVMTSRKASPNQTVRPFTRSMAQKKDSGKSLPKLQPQNSYARKILSSSRSELKQKSEEKNIFAFDEGEKRMQGSMFTANGHLPVSAQKQREIKSAKVEPRRISFHNRSGSRKILQSNDKEQQLPPPENEANRTHAVRDTQTGHCDVKNKNQQPPNSISGKFVHPTDHHLENLTSLANSSETQDLDCPPLQREFKGSQDRSLKDGYLLQKVWSPTPARRPKSLDHLYSPTFAVNITPSPPERKSSENKCHGPILSEEKALAGSFKSPPSPRACSSESVAHAECSDGSRDTQASPTGESSPVVKGMTRAKSFSPSHVQPLSSESLETDEIIVKGFRKTERWSSKASGYTRSPFTLRQGKRVRSLEDAEVRKFDPSSVFPFNFSGTGEAVGSHCLPGQSSEDSLARGINQLAVVLERFKAKIKAHTGKRSSEILSSVGDTIHLQLQEVETLIQADVEKFISLGKSKRKRLESTFLEQQEKLNAIQEKFKEEVNQHLLDCRSTLDQLEACQKELKGNVERQKAAHRKLILQVKQAMEAQLEDAETSITGIQKAARRKMEGMKQALRGWLNDNDA